MRIADATVCVMIIRESSDSEDRQEYTHDET